MQRWLSYISKLGLTVILLGALEVCAQETPISVGDEPLEENDTTLVKTDLKVETEVDSSAYYPFLSRMSVYIDYGKLATYWTDFEKKGEIGLGLKFKKSWLLSAEIGHGILTPQSAYSNANYESKGLYWRAGLGYHIEVNPKSNVTLRALYGSANFEDNAVVRVTSTSGLHDDLVAPFDRSGLTAQWYEFALGTESQLANRLYAGVVFRFRVMNRYDEQTPIDVYTIPGYGRTFDQSVPALNFYLRFAIFSFKDEAQ